jgi:16S rRNA processing protein RimM
MSGTNERPAGSLKTGEPAFLAAGKVRRPHGVHGDVLLELYTDFPERLQPGKIVFLGEGHERVIIVRQRSHNQGMVLAFEGFDTPEAIGRFRNQTLYVTSAGLPDLPDGVFYFHELFNLNVEDDTSMPLGILTEIIKTGANDVYVVTTPSGNEILLPAIPEVIKDVNLDEHRMTVHLMPGLLDETSDES